MVGVGNTDTSLSQSKSLRSVNKSFPFYLEEKWNSSMLMALLTPTSAKPHFQIYSGSGLGKKTRWEN